MRIKLNTHKIQLFLNLYLIQNKPELVENISKFEFIKPSKDLFLRHGKEKYRQDRF